MTTTVMRNSRVGDAWIQEMARLNPTQWVVGADGQRNGNITLFARLAWTDALFTAKAGVKNPAPGAALKYYTTLLLTPWTDMTILWEEYNRICAADFQQFFNGQYYAVDNPIRPCAEKPNMGGYTPGLFFTNVSSNFKPPIVDAGGNPIVDPQRVYPGVWAIAAVNAYASGKGQPKKGPRFGLQTIMIVGDDENLGGAAPDPQQMFRGVKVQPPAVQPGQQFGQQVMGAPPPAGGVGAFYGAAPPAGAPPAGVPAYGAPAVPPGFPPAGGAPTGFPSSAGAPPVDPLAAFKR